MLTAVAEVIADAEGEILLRFTVPDGRTLVIEMTPDEARGFSNLIGGAILAASETRKVRL